MKKAIAVWTMSKRVKKPLESGLPSLRSVGLMHSKRGIAIWTMSKVVMFIFLVLTFGSIIAYTQLLGQRVTADSAQSVTLQLKSILTAVLSSDALDATLVVPLPGEIPERTKGVYETVEAPLHPYNVVTMISSDGTNNYITFAISLQDINKDPGNTEYLEKAYIAASWLLLPEDARLNYDLGHNDLHFVASSKDVVQYRISKKTDESSGKSTIYFQACNMNDPPDCWGAMP